MSKEERFEYESSDLFGDTIIDNKENKRIDDDLSIIARLLNQLDQENQELKKQLAEKEKEIEEINREFVQSTHDWKEIFKEKIQAKTDFAIEQLKQTKKLIEEKYTYDVEESDWAVVYELDIDEIFDQQLNKLKEGK